MTLMPINCDRHGHGRIWEQAVNCEDCMILRVRYGQIHGEEKLVTKIKAKYVYDYPTGGQNQ